jgi:hypothetical protein
MIGVIEIWTLQNDERLAELMAAGETWEDIGRRLSRTPRAVYERARKLKLSIGRIRSTDKPQHAGKVPLPKPQERPDDRGLKAKGQ